MQHPNILDEAVWKYEALLKLQMFQQLRRIQYIRILKYDNVRVEEENTRASVVREVVREVLG